MTAEWLREMGLTDREIAVCSRLWADGMSLREAADEFEISYMQVRRYRLSAEGKLRAAGVTIPVPPRGRKPKTRRMDGRSMGRRFTDADKYNAR
jgi:DNA-binding CsgD family transcriptional regulator